MPGWRLERDVDPPSYAVIVPQSTDTNVDSVVLACEAADTGRVLQLQIYLTDQGPLLPKGARAAEMKPYPRAEIAIDQHAFQTEILFSEDHAVLADGEVERFPALSGDLLDAMTEGQTMVLRFDLLAETRGQPAAFDGEAVIDLKAGMGGRAVAAVRRCAIPVDKPADEPPNIARAS